MGLAGLATLQGDHRIRFDPRNFRFTAASKCDSGGETVESSDDEEEDEENIENNNVEDHLGWEEQQGEDLLGGEKLSLKNLKWIATLGVGGFGRVELVTAGHGNNIAFALKKMKKNEVGYFSVSVRVVHSLWSRAVQILCSDCLTMLASR